MQIHFCTRTGRRNKGDAMKNYLSLSRAELEKLLLQLETEYSEWQGRKLKLDMSRGKPAPSQLDLCSGLLDAMPDFHAADGTDCRNYGVLGGIPELRALFADLLGLDPERILAAGNSSLNLMYDVVTQLMLFGIGGNAPWCRAEKLKFLCPVPGYDRHFRITQDFGFELIPVPLRQDGPDMETVEQLVGNDPAVKGIWCVPLYSNPSGVCYSEATVRRLGAMKCAAPDFRIFWDNAYGVHHLYEPTPLADIFAACAAGGNPNRAFYFFSTSKITYPGAGVAMLAAGPDDFKEIMRRLGTQIISYDKMNQLRTVRFLKNAAGVRALMAKHAEALRPKFEIVARTLADELAGSGLGEWSDPRGGYFVSFNTLPGCAKETVRLAAEAGVKMTGAGATWPHGVDPADRNIRIAPTYPSKEELATAMKLFTLCVKLAAVRKLLAGER